MKCWSLTWFYRSVVCMQFNFYLLETSNLRMYRVLLLLWSCLVIENHPFFIPGLNNFIFIFCCSTKWTCWCSYNVWGTLWFCYFSISSQLTDLQGYAKYSLYSITSFINLSIRFQYIAFVQYAVVLCFFSFKIDSCLRPLSIYCLFRKCFRSRLE